MSKRLDAWRQKKRARDAIAKLNGAYPLSAPVQAPWLQVSDGMPEVIANAQDEMIALYTRTSFFGYTPAALNVSAN